jgi:hypothetical protein
MKPLTLDEIKAAIEKKLRAAFQDEVGLTDEMLAAFHANGIPAEWVTALEPTFPELGAAAWPKVIHPPRVLHKRSTSSTLNSRDMEDHQRLAISGGRRQTPWRRALKAKKISQNEMADKVGMSQALLSMCRRDTPIRRSFANKIATLIDWPADRAHWPGGFVEE